MARRVTDKEKKEIIESFRNGKTIIEISNSFKFTKSTITRQLKKLLTNLEFENLNRAKKKESNKSFVSSEEINLEPKIDFNNKINNFDNLDNFSNKTDFYEISPLEEEYQFNKQRELASKPLTKNVFPKVVFLIVDAKIELEPKYLKDYPEWSFLPDDDQNRKSIKIFSDQKKAKNNCTKNQKVELILIPRPKSLR